MYRFLLALLILLFAGNAYAADIAGTYSLPGCQIEIGSKGRVSSHCSKITGGKLKAKNGKVRGFLKTPKKQKVRAKFIDNMLLGKLGSKPFAAIRTASIAPSSPTEFKRFLSARINAGDYDCGDLGKLDERACLTYQAAQGIVAASGKPDRFETYYAIEAMNFTSSELSSARYSLFARKPYFIQPGTDPDLCIDLGYGICGNHTAVFMALMERVGVEARQVQIFHYYDHNGQRASHIAAEVNINGWKFFDTTAGAFWYSSENDPIGTILAFEDITPITPRKVNFAQTWAVHYSTFGLDLLGYLTAERAGIVYGYDNGTIRLDRPSPAQGFDFIHVPKYVGDNVDDGPFEGVSFAFEAIPGLNTFTVDGAVVGCAAAKLCMGSACVPISAYQPIPRITATDVSSFHIESSDRLCYAALRNIAF